MPLKLPPDVEQVLAAGLRWIFDTEQPDGAMVSYHGYSRLVDDVVYGFCGRGADDLPVVTLNRLAPIYGDDDLLNPLTSDELLPVPVLLLRLGHPANRFWNSADPAALRGDTGSFGLAQPAHPSLIAALDRYRAGCPVHHTVFCGAPGQQECTWLRDGYARAVLPTWPVEVAE